jgi:hypothetical protein
MSNQNPPRKRYAAVNRCIYCGRTEADGRLTSEHILALSLGGREELPKASCDPCAAITRDIEQFVAVDMLKAPRTKFRMKSRRKLPEALPIQFTDQNGNESYERVAISDHPATIGLIRVRPPALLDGREPSQMIQGWPWIFVTDREAHNRMARRNPTYTFTMAEFHVEKFNRVLAKTAYAVAVAELGLGTFLPLVTSLILDGSNLSETFVGGEVENPAPEPFLHKVHVFTPYYANDRCYVVVTIRLFAQLGGPVYHVVVGEQNIPPFEFSDTPKPIRGEWYWHVVCRQCRKPFPILHDASKGTWNGLIGNAFLNVTCPSCGARCIYTTEERKRWEFTGG